MAVSGSVRYVIGLIGDVCCSVVWIASLWLCLQVFHELLDVLHNARCDDSHVLLLTGSGNVFCSGVDLHYLLTECTDRRVAAKTMSDCLRSVNLTGVRHCLTLSHSRHISSLHLAVVT